MLNSGFVKIHRKIVDSALWQDLTARTLAITILLMANYKDGEFVTKRGTLVKVKRGELATTERNLAYICGISRRKVRTGLEHLRNYGFSTQLRDRWFTMISVVKYSQYQDVPEKSAQQSAQPRPNLGPDIRIEKKVKNVIQPNTTQSPSFSVGHPSVDTAVSLLGRMKRYNPASRLPKPAELAPVVNGLLENNVHPMDILKTWDWASGHEYWHKIVLNGPAFCRKYNNIWNDMKMDDDSNGNDDGGTIARFDD